MQQFAIQRRAVLVASVIVPRGRVAVVEKTVAALADSMARIGLLNPITIQPESHLLQLVAGRNRLEAARRLGWEEIDALILPERTSDPMAAVVGQLAEIDENIVRRTFDAAALAHVIAERKRLYEQLHPETRAGVAQAVGMNAAIGRRVQVGRDVAPFSAATAKATGKSERTIRRAAQRGEALGADALRVAGTSLAKGCELDALAKLPPEKRAPLIARAVAGEPVSAAKHAAPIGSSRKRLVDAWEAASEADRKWFVSEYLR